MSFLKRIKNLWRLSEVELLTPEKEKDLNLGQQITKILKKNKMAKIIDISPPIDLDD